MSTISSRDPRSVSASNFRVRRPLSRRLLDQENTSGMWQLGGTSASGPLERGFTPASTALLMQLSEQPSPENVPSEETRLLKRARYGSSASIGSIELARVRTQKRQRRPSPSKVSGRPVPAEEDYEGDTEHKDESETESESGSEAASVTVHDDGDGSDAETITADNAGLTMDAKMDSMLNPDAVWPKAEHVSDEDVSDVNSNASDAATVMMDNSCDGSFPDGVTMDDSEWDSYGGSQESSQWKQLSNMAGRVGEGLTPSSSWQSIASEGCRQSEGAGQEEDPDEDEESGGDTEMESADEDLGDGTEDELDDNDNEVSNDDQECHNESDDTI